jgi:hypothetical protein
MSAAPELEELAKRLLKYEAVPGKPAVGNEIAAFRVCEKLRHPLSTLAGTAGFRSLLSRALTLANAKVHWLKAVHISPAGTLEGLDEVESQLSPDEIAAGEIALVARLLELLITFIGEALTLRLMQDVWPKAMLDDLYD